MLIFLINFALAAANGWIAYLDHNTINAFISGLCLGGGVIGLINYLAERR